MKLYICYNHMSPCENYSSFSPEDEHILLSTNTKWINQIILILNQKTQPIMEFLISSYVILWWVSKWVILCFLTSPVSLYFIFIRPFYKGKLITCVWSQIQTQNLLTIKMLFPPLPPSYLSIYDITPDFVLIM